MSWRLGSRSRVPVVFQMTAADCGAACLAMILGYHGRKFPLADCRDRLGIGRDGASAGALARTARTLGLSAQGYLLAPTDLARVPMPAIAHWEGDHFVVLERVARGGIWIVDPAVGRRRIGIEELTRAMGGIVLAFEPDPTFQRTTRRRRRTSAVWVREWKSQLHGHRSRLASVFVASAAIQALGLVVPLVTANVIDKAVGSHHSQLLSILPILMVTLVVAQFTISHARTAVLLRLERDLDARLGTRVVSHLLSLPLVFFQRRASGDLKQRIASTVAIREALTTQTVTALLDAVLMLIYLVLLLTYDLAFGLLALGVALTQLLILASTSSSARQLDRRYLLAEARSQSLLFELLEGIATIKATGAERRLLSTWTERLKCELAIKRRRDFLTGAVENGSAALRTLAPLATLWLGVHQVLTGGLSIGAVIALQTLTMSILVPLSSLATAVQRIRGIRAHAERLDDILTAEPERQAPAPAETPRLKGGIELRAVSFRYTGQDAFAIRDVSLTIAPGSKVALVGRSGSGKTTLAMLLLGLYTASSGEVVYDGVPQRLLDPRMVRRQIGVVLQEPFLLGESIHANIAVTDPTLSDARVADAARRAALHDDVMAMPMRYGTRVGQGGSLVSGGQRQRIALARALAHDPTILLLDEATSHLDAQNERCIDQQLETLQCTRIVIAHRLSTVMTADQILVLEDGAVVERGTHFELLRQAGAYAELVNGQREAGLLHEGSAVA